MSQPAARQEASAEDAFPRHAIWHEKTFVTDDAVKNLTPLLSRKFPKHYDANAIGVLCTISFLARKQCEVYDNELHRFVKASESISPARMRQLLEDLQDTVISMFSDLIGKIRIVRNTRPSSFVEAKEQIRQLCAYGLDMERLYGLTPACELTPMLMQSERKEIAKKTLAIKKWIIGKVPPKEFIGDEFFSADQ